LYFITLFQNASLYFKDPLLQTKSSDGNQKVDITQEHQPRAWFFTFISLLDLHPTQDAIVTTRLVTFLPLVWNPYKHVFATGGRSYLSFSGFSRSLVSQLVYVRSGAEKHLQHSPFPLTASWDFPGI